MAPMTHGERFWATVSGERPDQVLYSADFTPDLKRRLIEHAGTEDLAGHYGFFAPASTGPRPPAGYTAPEYGAYYAGEKLPDGTTINGDGVAMIPANFFHFWGYHSPLRNAATFDQLDSYPCPDQADWPTDHMQADVDKAHAAGNVAVVWVGHMYETAWQIRGYEPFLIDMIERPDWAECMLDKTHRRALARALAGAQAGADILMCGDDVANQNAMMFSMPMWRSFMLSRWQKVWSAVRAINRQTQIWYHSDGNIEAIIPELMAAGVNILNPVQPECSDPAKLRRQYPQLNFHGTIGTQSTMPWGKPDQVRAVVKDRIRTCGAHGRLILGPTHVLEPEVPIANIEAYVQAAQEGA